MSAFDINKNLLFQSLLEIYSKPATATSAVSLSCSDDSTVPDDIKSQYNDWISETEGVHPSFQILPGVFSQIGHLDINASSTRNMDNVSFLSGDRSCPKKMKIKSDNMNDRALCPWYFLLSHDDDRYPPILATAKCKCNRCYGEQDNRKKGRNAVKSRCQEIPYRHKVLKQKYDSNNNKVCDSNGKYEFVRTYETVSIGCTCVVPKKDVYASEGKFVRGH